MIFCDKFYQLYKNVISAQPIKKQICLQNYWLHQNTNYRQFMLLLYALAVLKNKDNSSTKNVLIYGMFVYPRTFTKAVHALRTSCLYFK